MDEDIEKLFDHINNLRMTLLGLIDEDRTQINTVAKALDGIIGMQKEYERQIREFDQQLQGMVHWMDKKKPKEDRQKEYTLR